MNSVFNDDGRDVRVLHVNDCAFYAERVLAEASSRGWPWRFYARATARSARGLLGQLQYATDGISWLIGLAWRSLSTDLLHIHSGSMLHHTRYIPKKFVLTLHGSDIRSLQYDPRWRSSILKGIKRAAVVMYTTPDLREHVIPHRPDAIYLPVPISVGALPAADPDGAEKPRVLFVSRWDDSKGAHAQLETARELVRLSRGRYEVYGLDWGPSAADASALGVKLITRMDHQSFLAFLSGSRLAVGQSSGLLGASELEALGMGVPLYMPLEPGLYPADLPVGWGRRVDPQAMAELINIQVDSAAAMAVLAESGPRWISANHDAATTVDRLAEIYCIALGRMSGSSQKSI